MINSELKSENGLLKTSEKHGNMVAKKDFFTDGL